jgi:crotonobetainyl-CoA:carnitine CoA-transferase CaiB-like acyl-CoA transferase
VCVVAASDANFRRLCEAMKRPDLLEDERFATLAARAAAGDAINAEVAAWAATLTAAELEAACVAHDVPVGTAYTAEDIAADPHLEARGDLVTVDDPVVGPIRQQAPYPRFDGERPDSPAGAPELGAHNREVWCGLVGLTDAELTALQAAGIV